MQTGNKIKSVWKKLRFSYKLTIFNEHTLEQVLMFRISRLTVILSMLIAVLIIGALTIYLITRTPLRRTLPGYVSPEMRSQIVDNALAVDSLTRIVNINKAYLDNLANIFSGNIPLDSIDINSEQTLQTYSIDSLLPASNATNSFLRKYAEEGKYTLDVFNQNVADNLIFYPPVKGRVTQTYNPQRRIFGIRITPPRQSPVAAVLDGTVIATYFTAEEGYVIEVQHNNNYISIYRCNDRLLKSVGQKVSEGENIAISGNLIEGKIRPYVEFQLWHQGVPLNPSEYIHF
ncbi:MAG TPA: M23 family metallopeptidase [Candidatus Caccoplasma merdavium]|nr:M23 family metallopeptidase [Candidatus Caccoplasma merdavium]